MKTFASLLLLVSFALSGCSTFSQSGRDRRAYEKYVRRSSIARVKQSRRWHSAPSPQLPPMQQPSEPVESTSMGPESVSSSGRQG